MKNYFGIFLCSNLTHCASDNQKATTKRGYIVATSSNLRATTGQPLGNIGQSHGNFKETLGQSWATVLRTFQILLHTKRFDFICGCSLSTLFNHASTKSLGVRKIRTGKWFNKSQEIWLDKINFAWLKNPSGFEIIMQALSDAFEAWAQTKFDLSNNPRRHLTWNRGIVRGAGIK